MKAQRRQRYPAIESYSTEQLEAVLERTQASVAQAKNYILDNPVLGEGLKQWQAVYKRKSAAAAGIQDELNRRARENKS